MECRGFIKRREAGIFPFYSGMFPLLLLINLYRVYRQIPSNHPLTLPCYPDAKKVNETPGMFSNPLYSGIGKTPFQHATQCSYSVVENVTRKKQVIAMENVRKLCSKHGY